MEEVVVSALDLAWDLSLQAIQESDILTDRF